MKKVKQIFQLLSIAVLALSLVTSCEKTDDPDEDYSSGGTTTSSGNNGGSSSDSKYCKYIGSSTGYWKSGGSISSEKLYIYKTPDGEKRVATSKSSYHTKSSTNKIYVGSDPWGLKCNRYYLSIGIAVYFKM